MKFYRLLHIAILLCFCSFLHHIKPVDKIKSGLVSFYKNYPQEKIYVQTDKDRYITGQSVWFGIYAMIYGAPSDLSKIVYVQLLNPEGNIVMQKKMPVVKGLADGDLTLPDSLRTNVYQLRCFTAWMLNFDEYFIFHKAIYIQNLTQQVNHTAKNITPANRYHLNFFPEGGDMIDSNQVNVAFKAIDDNGLPVTMSGEIKNELDSLVAKLQTEHDGMGEFSFRPEMKHKYYADVRFLDGTTKSVQLPDIKAFGITLKIIDQNDEEINIRIIHHDKYAKQFEDLILAAYQNSGKIAVYPLQLEKKDNIFSIKKEEFSSGILRITVFDQDGVPLAERVLFLDKNNALKIVLIKDSLSFTPRSKNEFTVHVKNADGKIDKANFSVTVTDADKTFDDTLSNNIYSSFLLSSELKGYIHDPAFYFLNSDDKTKKALDLVMLTNGWRHFKWEEVLNEKPEQLKYAVEKEQYVEGEIVNYNKELFKEQGIKLKIVIQNEDSSKFVGYAEPDSSGKFLLKDYPVTGKSTIYFEGTGGKNKTRNIRVRFFSSTQDIFRRAPYLLMPVDNGYANAIVMKKDSDEIEYRKLQKIKTLKSVTIRGHIPTKADQVVSKYVTPYFAADEATSIDLVNNFYPNSIRLYDFMKGRFPGLYISGNEDNVSFLYHGSVENILQGAKPSNSGTGGKSGSSSPPPTTSTSKQPPSYPYFYVNEILTPWGGVKDIPLSDIALIQFLPPPVPMAPLNGGFMGAISIYTKKGDEIIPTSITADYNHYTFSGYSVSREFYSPDYNAGNIDRSIPDVRSTLYWNPRLVLDNNNGIRFHFFNSDNAKKFRVVIEGMDEQGRLGFLNTIIDNANH